MNRYFDRKWTLFVGHFRCFQSDSMNIGTLCLCPCSWHKSRIRWLSEITTVFNFRSKKLALLIIAQSSESSTNPKQTRGLFCFINLLMNFLLLLKRWVVGRKSPLWMCLCVSIHFLNLGITTNNQVIHVDSTKDSGYSMFSHSCYWVQLQYSSWKGNYPKR